MKYVSVDAKLLGSIDPEFRSNKLEKHVLPAVSNLNLLKFGKYTGHTYLTTHSNQIKPLKTFEYGLNSYVLYEDQTIYGQIKISVSIHEDYVVKEEFEEFIFQKGYKKLKDVWDDYDYDDLNNEIYTEFKENHSTNIIQINFIFANSNSKGAASELLDRLIKWIKKEKGNKKLCGVIINCDIATEDGMQFYVKFQNKLSTVFKVIEDSDVLETRYFYPIAFEY